MSASSSPIFQSHRKEKRAANIHDRWRNSSGCNRSYTIYNEHDVSADMKELSNAKPTMSPGRDDMLMYANRTVVQTSLRSEMSDRIHQDVMRIAACEHCQTFNRSQPKQPLMTTPFPSLPWEKLGIDMMCLYGGQNYLVIVDWGVSHTTQRAWPSQRTSSPASVFQNIFSRQQSTICVVGIPIICSEQMDYSHNGKPFLPSANWEAERPVQTIKRFLRQRDSWLAILIFRDTVISATGTAPSAVYRPTRKDESSDYSDSVCGRVSRARRTFAKMTIKPRCHTHATPIIVTVLVR